MGQLTCNAQGMRKYNVTVGNGQNMGLGSMDPTFWTMDHLYGPDPWTPDFLTRKIKIKINNNSKKNRRIRYEAIVQLTYGGIAVRTQYKLSQKLCGKCQP